MDENAVSRMTGTSGSAAFSALSTCRPSPSGSLKSRRTRSMSGPNLAMADLAVSASTTVWPSCDSRCESVQRIRDSSSTTRIVAAGISANYVLSGGARGPDHVDHPGHVERLRQRAEGAGADRVGEQLRRAVRGHHDDAT